MINGLQAMPQMKVSVPEGSYFAFPDVSGFFGMMTPKGKIIKSSEDVRNFLLDNGIGVLDGKHCGMDNHIRIAFTAPPEQIAEGVQAMQDAFKQLVRLPGTTLKPETQQPGHAR
jgi:aspartate aminotransferase